MTRVYLPVALDELRALRVGPLVGSRVGCAVTPRLQAKHPSGDQEEWEFYALREAVYLARTHTNLDSAGASPGGAVPDGVEVVVSADVPATAVVSSSEGEADGLAQVVVMGPLEFSAVACLHVPDPGDLGGSPWWYDISELEQVIAQFG